MKQLLFSLSRFVVVFLASSIVFFALVVVVAHILTPYFNHRVQVIERFAANLLHKPVQIHQFSVRWQGLMLILKGNDVIVWNDSRTQAIVQVKELEVGIDLVKTLLTGNITLGEFNGRGLGVVVHQTKSNQFVFSGVSSLFGQSSNDVGNGIKEILGWVLAEPTLSLQDVNLIFYPAIGPKWPDMQLDAVLQNQANRHKLSVQLKFLEKRPSSLRLMADLTTASPLSSLSSLLAKAEGRVYLEGHAILLDRWLQAFVKKYSIQSIANFSVWLDWQQDHFTQVQARLSNSGNSVLQFDKQPPITIMPFSGNARWKLVDNGNWIVNAVVQHVGFYPWKKIPGVKGLNAYATITPSTGSVIAYAKNLDLDFMKLFKAPIHLDSLVSRLNWQREGDEFLVKIPKFNAENADVAVNAQMGFLFPVHEKESQKGIIAKTSFSDKSSQISLLAHLKTRQPSHIASYLPQPFVAPALIQWLSTAIVKGSAEATLILQGPIVEFPFDKNDGTFLINTEIKGGELHYESAWPHLKKINGELIFSGRSMQMLIHSAEVFSTPLRNIQANIPLIKTHVQAVLHIVVNAVNTRLEKGLAFLEATPLAKVEGQLGGIVLTGPLKLALQLVIPLESGKEKLNVLGSGVTENAKVKIPSHNIQIDNLKGQFSLSQKGVQAQNLLGTLWNKPIAIAIRSVPSTQLTINYSGIQTTLVPEKKEWRFLINNKTAQGSVLIPTSKQQAIEANFNSIILDSAISSQAGEWNFKQIPMINFNAREVRYKDMVFGAVQLKLRPKLGGISIRELQAGNASYHLIASGAWHNQQNKLTAFVGQLDSSNLSDFLRSWGLPASITADQAHIRFNLKWPGAPYEISATKLQGNFSFTASNGQIVDIGSSAEAKLSFGRLLTFLSLQSLGRRLQLDFSDLKAKGFDFTRLKGDFILRDGNAFTRDTTIEGSVAAITLTGRIGLSAKDYDLTIRIVPHFTSSLPVIVGLAGGPIAGAITWIANAVLGSTVQKIAETTYHMTGSWGKPEVIKTST